MNSSNRYQLVEALYQRAVDLPPDRRAAFLTEQCDNDAGLREEVETLLEHYEIADDGFLCDPVHEYADQRGDRQIPTRIGPFEIVRLIGEGAWASSTRRGRRIRVEALQSR